MVVSVMSIPEHVVQYRVVTCEQLNMKVPNCRRVKTLHNHSGRLDSFIANISRSKRLT